ncbi:MAG: TetR family transcriptional regulator [Oscillospiraceae bacterium]|nr:TetR family transcriptional regulator [Oscillospiraceae bacterium]
MAGKYREISEQTRQNFIDAFWQLYEKKDINKIKVQEICDIAGYHRNTFYHYFTDVYDVLNQIEDRIINELIENSDEDMLFYENGVSAKKFTDVYERNKKYLKILADDEKGSRFPSKMSKVLKQENKKKFIFCDDNNKNEYIYEYKISGAIAAIMHYFKDDNGLSLKEILELVLEMSVVSKWPPKTL